MKILRDVLRAPDPAPGGAPSGAPTPPDPKDLEIQRLQAALRAPVPPTAPTPPQPSKTDVEKIFWQNPLDSTAAIATHAANQAMAGSQETLIELAKTQARGDDSIMQKIWDKYIDEITAHVSTVAPQFRTNLNVWKNAFSLVKGQHIQEILEMQKTNAPAPPIVSGDGPAAPSVRTPAATPSVPLSAEESYVARNLGLTEEQYRHGKSIRENQHGREKSPWDEVITTDSSRRGVKRVAA